MGVNPAQVPRVHKTSVNKEGAHSFNLNTVQIKKASQPHLRGQSLKEQQEVLLYNLIIQYI